MRLEGEAAARREIMNRRSKTRLIWTIVAVAAIVSVFYFSSAAMTWLRVTLHGR
jgi:hypothetical protein